MSGGTSIHLSLIIERAASSHPWLDDEWTIAGLMPVREADKNEPARLLKRTDTSAKWLSEPSLLELHRTDLDAYIYNLTAPMPAVYAVAQELEEPIADGLAWRTHLVTLSSYEAEEYMSGDDALIGKLAMPDDIREWLEAFVALHYKETEFKKRRRDRLKLEDHKFGQEKLVELRQRMLAAGAVKPEGEVQ